MIAYGVVCIACGVMTVVELFTTPTGISMWLRFSASFISGVAIWHGIETIKREWR